MAPTSEHWDSIFSGADDSKLGWYEKDASQTLSLLKPVPDWESSSIFIVGVGTSELIEKLLSQSVSLSLNDISAKALDKVKARLGEKSNAINWLCQDISLPIIRDPDQNAVPKVDIWIDRAVLHFLNSENAIKGYFTNLTSLLKEGGYALFAEFSMSGASKCAGLEVHRYSVEELSERLGSSFQLIKSFDHTYLTPSGDPRPYIYSLFKRIS